MVRAMYGPRKGAASVLALYCRDISATPVLSAAEEKRLAEAVQCGDVAARDHLVRANLGLVVDMARRHVGKGLDLEDLIAEGNLGLMRAVELFDPDRGVRFSTYASYWVKEAIRHALLTKARVIRIPRHLVNLLSLWRRTETQLQDALGRPPTEEEVGHALGLSARRQRVVASGFRLLEAQPTTGQQGGPFQEEDLLVAKPPSDTEEPGLLPRLLAGLTENEAAVLRLRFGLAGAGPMTLREAGERTGLTRERVRQLERVALLKLRRAAGAD